MAADERLVKSEAPRVQTRLAFEAAIEPILPRLFRYALALTGSREDAEDLLQNAILRAFLHRDTYEGRGRLDGWLLRIVRREHEESIRSRARRRSLFRRMYDQFGEIFGSSDAPPEPETIAIARQTSAGLLRALQEVPEPQRTVVWLCDIEELSYDEVATILEIPMGTVKSRHARGRQRLRHTIEANPAGGHHE